MAAGGRGIVAVLHDPGAARRAAVAGVGAAVDLPRAGAAPAAGHRPLRGRGRYRRTSRT
jgi:microcystin degradation protein MlrC